MHQILSLISKFIKSWIRNMPLCCTSKTPKWTVLKVIYAQDILTSLDLAGIWSSRGNVILSDIQDIYSKALSVERRGRLVFLPTRYFAAMLHQHCCHCLLHEMCLQLSSQFWSLPKILRYNHSPKKIHPRFPLQFFGPETLLIICSAQNSSV